MDMEHDKTNDFTDWLYNRYIESLRKEDFARMLVFLDVMNQYFIKALTQRRFSKQKRYMAKLLKTIEKAHKSGTTKKLQLVGVEWQQEFERAIKEYETALTELNFSKERIKELVIEKRCNYGNN